MKKNGWLVLCNKEKDWRMFKRKKDAIECVVFWNKKYKEICKHQVIPCEFEHFNPYDTR